MRELNEPDREFISCELCWDEAIDLTHFARNTKDVQTVERERNVMKIVFINH